MMLIDLRRMLRTGEDIRVKPGDVIYLPRKRSVVLQEFVGRFTQTLSPLFTLYTDAYDAFYIDRRTQAFLDSVDNSNDLATIVGQINLLRDLIGDSGGTP